MNVRRLLVISAAALVLALLPLSFAATRFEELPEAVNSMRTSVQSVTPQPPAVGNVGINRTSELGAFRSSGLLSSTPIAADHDGPGAIAPMSTPWPTARQPPLYVTLREFAAVLDSSTWPTTLRTRALAEVMCESGADLDGDGITDHIDLTTPGDAGSSVGPFKVHVPAHAELAGKYDLEDLRANVDAAYELYQQALQQFGDGWQPWSKC